MPSADRNQLNLWLEKIESSHPSEIDMGLDRVLMVHSKLKLKAIAPKVVVVSGTNGKGSTIAMLEKMLLAEGVSVGVYSSPHINHYNERVRINGEDIDDRSLVAGFDKVESARGSIPLTYFEFGTLCALCCLAANSLDVVLLEVGLGGRLDAVNIVDGDLAIITSIDIDHTDWLGTDRESIGFEKAGILRHSVPAIYGEANPPLSVTQQADAQNVTLYTLQKEFGLLSDPECDTLECKQGYVSDSLKHCKKVDLPESMLPENNILIALQAMEILGFPIHNQQIHAALDHFVVPGRFELVLDSPSVFLDVGHNPHAAIFLARRLGLLSKVRPVYAVFSIMADKDLGGLLEPMSGVVEEWFVAPLKVARGASAEQIADTLSQQALIFCDYADLEAAFDSAHEKASKNNGIVICFGSFFVVSCIKQHIASQKASMACSSD